MVALPESGMRPVRNRKGDKLKLAAMEYTFR
jgi:hypothetical protein